MKYVPLDKLVFALCLVATLAAKSGEDWGMKKRRSSDEDWGMKRARGSDEDWGMKRARGSDEDWGMKRARGSDEDWGMKRARGSDEDWGMKKKRSQVNSAFFNLYRNLNLIIISFEVFYFFLVIYYRKIF